MTKPRSFINNEVKHKRKGNLDDILALKVDINDILVLQEVELKKFYENKELWWLITNFDDLALYALYELAEKLLNKFESDTLSSEDYLKARVAFVAIFTIINTLTPVIRDEKYRSNRSSYKPLLAADDKLKGSIEQLMHAIETLTLDDIRDNLYTIEKYQRSIRAYLDYLRLRVPPERKLSPKSPDNTQKINQKLFLISDKKEELKNPELKLKIDVNSTLSFLYNQLQIVEGQLQSELSDIQILQVLDVCLDILNFLKEQEFLPPIVTDEKYIAKTATFRFPPDKRLKDLFTQLEQDIRNLNLNSLQNNLDKIKNHYNCIVEVLKNFQKDTAVSPCQERKLNILSLSSSENTLFLLPPATLRSSSAETPREQQIRTTTSNPEGEAPKLEALSSVPTTVNGPSRVEVSNREIEQKIISLEQRKTAPVSTFNIPEATPVSSTFGPR